MDVYQLLMKRLNSRFLLFMCLIGTQLNAQQEVNHTLYRYHLNLINPAVTGVSGALFANLSLRSQWVGIEDAPETQALSAGIPNNQHHLGTGFSVINDKTFVENQTQIFADFSYHLPLGEEEHLYLGLKAGGTSIRLQADQLRTYGSNQNDQYLSNQSSFVPNIGAGVYYRRLDFFASLSIPRLLNTERFRYDDGQVSRATDRPHFYGAVGSRIILGEDWSFLPSLLFSYVRATPTSYMLQGAFAYQQLMELGVLYTRGGGIGGTTLFKVNDSFQMGYSYLSSAVDRVTRFSKGTHEFCIKITSKNTASKGSKEAGGNEQIIDHDDNSRRF